MLIKNVFSNAKKVYSCLVKAFKVHVKIEKIIYEYITEDEISEHLFTDENIVNYNKQLDNTILKMYNLH